MDSYSTTSSAVTISGEIKSDTGNSSLSLNVSPVVTELVFQNKLLLYGDILLFAILIFMSFKVGLKGLWR